MLAKGQMDRSMGQNKPPHMWSINILQRYKDNSVEGNLSFQQMILGQSDIHMQRKNLNP